MAAQSRCLQRNPWLNSRPVALEALRLLRPLLDSIPVKTRLLRFGFLEHHFLQAQPCNALYYASLIFHQLL